jgi:hypothetical protein
MGVSVTGVSVMAYQATASMPLRGPIVSLARVPMQTVGAAAGKSRMRPHDCGNFGNADTYNRCVSHARRRD